MRRALPPLALLVAASVCSLAASAKDKDDKSAKPSDKAISAYDQQIADAHKSFAAGLAGGALDEGIAGYRKAIALDPNRPEGHLFLGGALFQKADFSGAEEAFSSARDRAKADKAFLNLQGKSLFMLATIKDAQNKSEEGKAAWKAYEDFAKEHPDQPLAGSQATGDAPPMVVKVYPASAVDRQAKIDAYAKSVSDYAKVKDLILKRQKELGEPSSPTPSGSAKTK